MEGGAEEEEEKEEEEEEEEEGKEVVVLFESAPVRASLLASRLTGLLLRAVPLGVGVGSNQDRAAARGVASSCPTVSSGCRLTTYDLGKVWESREWYGVSALLMLCCASK